MPESKSTCLIKTTEDFAKELQERIEIGKVLKENINNISNQSSLAEQASKCSKWNGYNIELLKQSFSDQNSSYYRDYWSNYNHLEWWYEFEHSQRKQVSYPFNGNKAKNDIQSKIQYLDKLLDKLPLIPVKLQQAEELESNLVGQVVLIAKRFKKVAKQFNYRYDNRPILQINDEYDVQDLFRNLLYLFTDYVKDEERAPSFAAKSSRIDFILSDKNGKNIALETKMIRKGLDDKKLGEELILDIAKYENYPNCTNFIAFVYDPTNLLKKPEQIIKDLENRSKPDYQIQIIISD